MTVSIRRLGPGDEDVLASLAADDADFGLSGPGEPDAPLAAGAARRYLDDPGILHWVAAQDGQVVGHLQCIRLPMRAGDPHEVLLYDIGVRRAWRRRGIGRALVGELWRWMRTNRIRVAWVLAEDPEAVEFYTALGFVAGRPSPSYLVLRVGGETDGRKSGP
jgi:ribosomal protein S18 acetylase RimI-like enzyme